MFGSKNAQLQAERDRQEAERQRRLADEALAQVAKLHAQTAVTKITPAEFNFSILANSYHHAVLPVGVSRHTMNIDVRTLHASIEDWKEVNPRIVNDTDTHVKLGILSTLRNEPSKMIVRNTGLTLTAKSVTVDPVTGKVNMKLTDKEIHGLLNGGHTAHWILQVAKEMKQAGKLDSWEAYVPVTIYVGFKTKEEVAEVSDPLNTNVAVKRSMSALQRGKYDILLDTLKSKHYYSEISLKGKKGIQLNDIFRILVAFDKYHYPNGDSNPIRVDLETSKKGKGSFTSILDEQFEAEFLPELDSAGNVVKFRNSMKILFENSDTLLRLSDQITRNVLENHEKLLRDVVSGGKNPKRMLAGNKTRMRFIGTEDAPIMVAGQRWKGWLLPIIGAFRANVVWDSQNESIDWIVPNSVLIKSAMPEMLKVLIKTHKAKDSNPANLLRDTDTYVELYKIAEAHIIAIQEKAAKAAAKKK